MRFLHARLWRSLRRDRRCDLTLGVVQPLPPEWKPDLMGFAGLAGLWQNVNAYANSLSAQASGAATTFTVPAAAIAAGIVNRTGSAGSAITDTTDTLANILSAMGNPPTIPLAGQFTKIVRWLNTTGQTITVAGGTGVTTSGTMTVATSAWRDFALNITSAAAATLTNVGGGTM